jgi:hypothetical protein
MNSELEELLRYEFLKSPIHSDILSNITLNYMHSCIVCNYIKKKVVTLHSRCAGALIFCSVAEV